VTQMVSAERTAALRKGCECFRSWHFCEVATGCEIVCLCGKTGSHRRTVKMTRLTLNG
jgi:hypothetical protein